MNDTATAAPRALVRRAKVHEAANHELLKRLFRTHESALRAHLYKRVRRRAEAEELAQEVYLRLLRVPDATVIRNPEAYLFTIARNLAKRHAWNQARAGLTTSTDTEDPLVQEQLSELPSYGDALDRQQRVARLSAVLEQLPPKCRAAVVLQYWHGMSYGEIAQQLGISTHMVKKYLSQALQHCRRRMARLK